MISATPPPAASTHLGEIQNPTIGTRIANSARSEQAHVQIKDQETRPPPAPTTSKSVTRNGYPLRIRRG